MTRVTPDRVRSRIALLLALAGGMSGCTTTTEMADGPKIVIDGDKYVVLEPQVGSHLKRRIKISELREPGIAPTRKDIVTAETDTTILPPTASEMQQALANQPPTVGRE